MFLSVRPVLLVLELLFLGPKSLKALKPLVPKDSLPVQTGQPLRFFPLVETGVGLIHR